jgi:hypothetical protein
MPKSQSPDFPIHVDGSCVTDSTDLQLSPKRNLSDQTVIHIEPSLQTDEHTEALIHAAARAIICSIENDAYNRDGDSAIRGDGYYLDETEMSYEETEGTYEDGTEVSYDDDVDHEGGYDEEHTDEEHNEHDTNEDPYDGSSSSHPEDDDVFSDSRRSSQGSSLNSSNEQHTDEDLQVVKKGANLHVKEQGNYLLEQSAEDRREERKADELTYENMSRLPSTSSSHSSVLHPAPLVLSSPSKHQTPSKILTRPPFRTPSSVRALQMSSPTPSIFSSPRSSKRPTTTSRSGTPNTLTGSPSKKTPTRFKMKKEELPLVLLHVTVLPLRWTHSELMDIAPVSVVSNDLQVVRESWKLLKEKLGDTVFERGILLSHPQDSYETLEERLLEALELPVRPRARILACGHYVGPSSTNFDSSASESSDADESDYEGTGSKALWCDICSREVKYSTLDIGVEKGRRKRFEVKVYASNGLMRAGAWAAAWREMERVDVEIEPFVDGNVVKEIIGLADAAAAGEKAAAARAEVEREQLEAQRLEEAQKREEEDFALMLREQREQSPPPRIVVDGNDITDAQIEEEQQWARRREMEEGEARRRKDMEEERLREIYGDQAPSSPEPSHNSSSHEKPATRSPNRRSHKAHGRHIDEDSLPALLLEAVKVLMRDRKNIALLVLSVLVLGLALNRAGTTHQILIQPSRDFGRVYAEVGIFNDGGPESAGETQDTLIDLSTTSILANMATSSIEVVASRSTIKAEMNSPVVAVELSSFAAAATHDAEVVDSSPSSNKQVHASIVAKEHTKIDEVLEQKVVNQPAVKTLDKAIESVTMEKSIVEETVEEPVVMSASESTASPSTTAHDDSVEPSLIPQAASKANVDEVAVAPQPKQPKPIATKVKKPIKAKQPIAQSPETELEQEMFV